MCQYIVIILISTGIALLRKYYKHMIQYLPDDHLATLSLLSENVHVEDFFFDQVLNCTNSKRANMKILNSIMMMIKEDDQLNSFCKVLRDLAGSKPITREILEFQIGIRIAICIHMYIVHSYIELCLN